MFSDSDTNSCNVRQSSSVNDIINLSEPFLLYNAFNIFIHSFSSSFGFNTFIPYFFKDSPYSLIFSTGIFFDNSPLNLSSDVENSVFLTPNSEMK